jgi:hypothetical protein
VVAFIVVNVVSACKFFFALVTNAVEILVWARRFVGGFVECWFRIAFEADSCIGINEWAFLFLVFFGCYLIHLLELTVFFNETI